MRRTNSNVKRTALAFCLACLLVPTLRANASSATALDLDGKAVDPLTASGGKVAVLIFVRTDCPVSNRYAPTIHRMIAAYAGKAVFWLVYPDKSTTPDAIRRHDMEYGYKIGALRDTQLALVKEARVKITPEVAVFDANQHLVYHGRIDNWYVDFGRARSAPTTHELDDAIQAAISGKFPSVRVTDAVGCYIADVE
jgi:hypothetical protein